jgi:hypothetical protein
MTLSADLKRQVKRPLDRPFPELILPTKNGHVIKRHMMPRTSPPLPGQHLESIANTRRRRCIQRMARSSWPHEGRRSCGPKGVWFGTLSAFCADSIWIRFCSLAPSSQLSAHTFRIPLSSTQTGRARRSRQSCGGNVLSCCQRNRDSDRPADKISQARRDGQVSTLKIECWLVIAARSFR